MDFNFKIDEILDVLTKFINDNLAWILLGLGAIIVFKIISIVFRKIKSLFSRKYRKKNQSYLEEPLDDLVGNVHQFLDEDDVPVFSFGGVLNQESYPEEIKEDKIKNIRKPKLKKIKKDVEKETKEINITQRKPLITKKEPVKIQPKQKVVKTEQLERESKPDYTVQEELMEVSETQTSIKKEEFRKNMEDTMKEKTSKFIKIGKKKQESSASTEITKVEPKQKKSLFKKVVKPSKKIDDSDRFLITSWQDDLLYDHFVKLAEESGAYGLWDEERRAKAVVDYIEYQSHWSKQKLNEIEPGLAWYISKEIFKMIKENLVNDDIKSLNNAIILLYTIDIINGFYDFKGKASEWIDEESFYPLFEHPDISKPLLRSYSLLSSLVETADKPYNMILLEYKVNDAAKAISNDQALYAIDELVSLIDFTKLKKKSQVVATWYLVEYLDNLVFNSQKTIKQLDLSYIRTLASILDKTDYNEIVETIN